MINSVCKNLKKKSDDFFSSDDKNTIISSYKQTKEWRKMQKWYKNGKSNECELYQKNIISVITKSEIKNTYIRINNEKNVLEIEKKPFTKENGFEYTEDFDGLIEKNSNKYLFNLKFICDEGGAQTRSLKQVYEFIKSQICLLKKNKENNIYFINILDGDTCFKHKNKFDYLTKKLDLEYKKYIFIGDMKDFSKFWI